MIESELKPDCGYCLSRHLIYAKMQTSFKRSLVELIYKAMWPSEFNCCRSLSAVRIDSYSVVVIKRGTKT